MKKYFVIVITLFLIFSSGITQAITLENLQQQFSQNKVVRADFKQDRFINGLSNPLHSTGKMIISQQDGLWWQQLSPFKMTLKMNQVRMEQNIDGGIPQIITAENQPQLFQFNHLLSAIFTADAQMLKNNFKLTLTEHDKQWNLTLIPISAPLNKIFKQIQLSGNVYLEKITLDDMQNDKTEITFFNHKTTKLTQHEQSLFK